MSILTDKLPPVSPLGPGIAGGVQGGANPPRLYASQARGLAPTVFSFDPRDVVTRTGRMNGQWIPISAVWEAFDRAVVFSPEAPISGRDVIASGVAQIVLTPGTSDRTSATYFGHDLRFAAIIIDLSTSNNVTPGDVDMTLTGRFEDGDIYTQSLTFSPGKVGVSRYGIMFTQEVDGGAYPCLVTLKRDVLFAAPGVAIPLAGETTITPEEGIRGPTVSLTADITGLDGTAVTAQLITPGSMLYTNFRSALMSYTTVDVP